MAKNGKFDPALIAVLINREHSRLSSQVKTLEKTLQAPFSDREYQRLKNLAAQWRDLLAFDDGAPELAEALETFIVAYRQQSPDRESLHDEVVFQAGIYRKGHWAITKHFIPDVSKSMDNFGGVKAKSREEFKRHYEADRKLTIEEQSQLLKTQYAMIPNRRDPYRIEALKSHGLVTEDGIVPMGMKEAQAMIEREDAAKPGKRGVVAWVADRFRRRR